MTTRDQPQIGWNASSATGVVAAGDPRSVAAGIGVLEMGGNAADAAAAVILALCVTDHYEFSIGGEVPVILFDASRRKVEVLSGQGGAPLSQEAIDWYMKNGIPDEGDMKIAPVPSVVDLCITMLKLYGTRSLGEVVAPTLRILADGWESWHPNLAHTLQRMVDEEGLTGGNRETKLQAACDRFYGRNKYRNDIAEELEAFYIERGGFLRRADLAAHSTRVEEPVAAEYRGYTVHKCGPWTQGPSLCQTLRILEGFDLSSMGNLSADYIHVMVEALKLGMADRDEYYGDPDFVNVPLDLLLSDRYTRLRRELVDMRRACPEARPGDPYNMKAVKTSGVFHPNVGGTTTCLVADRWGNVISATPSANVSRDDPQGGQAGVTYGNRLRSLNTTPGHPNCIAPGKRPRITLTPTMVLKNGEPVLAVSVAGGDMQDQITCELLSNFVDFGMLPDQAVRVPRFCTRSHQDSFDPNAAREQTYIQPGVVSVLEGFDAGVCRELELRGHRLERIDYVATPSMLHIDREEGVYRVAGDPCTGRHAAGLEGNSDGNGSL